MSSTSKPMSKFLCKAILFGSCTVWTSAQISSVRSLRWFSSSGSDGKQSFIVSYLINSLGFSPKAALLASRYVKLDAPNKPDKVIEFFKGYGFTHAQISRLVRAYPAILLCDAGKTILPKLEFLVGKGISGPELAKRLSVYPNVLRYSLFKQVMPTYASLRNLFQSDAKAIRAVRRYPDILTHSYEKYAGPNVAILREHGVPYSNIATWITRNPKNIIISPTLFRKIVEEVVAMGFNASRVNFVVAVSAIRGISQTKWESKVNTYKKWGWSEKEVLKAFQRQPKCMTISEDKISACMDFFTNKMGWGPCTVAKYPLILSMSLEKRIVPRCLVYQLLQSKGMVKKAGSLPTLLFISEKEFQEKFVTCYEKKAPKLLNLYKESILSFKGTRE